LDCTELAPTFVGVEWTTTVTTVLGSAPCPSIVSVQPTMETPGAPQKAMLGVGVGGIVVVVVVVVVVDVVVVVCAGLPELVVVVVDGTVVVVPSVVVVVDGTVVVVVDVVEVVVVGVGGTVVVVVDVVVVVVAVTPKSEETSTLCVAPVAA
jgi:hypothetical protein